MQSFTDKKKRKWFVEITWGTVKRIRRDLDMDISNFGDKGDSFITLLITDPEKLVDLLFALVKEQAKTISWKDGEEEKVGVDEIEFADGFSGDSIEEAVKAFTGAIVEFYPLPKRGAVEKTFQKMMETADLGFKKVEEEVMKIDPQTQVDKVFANTDTST